MNNEPQTDYDSPWKEALEQYLKAFMAFFFPRLMLILTGPRGMNFWTKSCRRWSEMPNWAGGWPTS